MTPPRALEAPGDLRVRGAPLAAAQDTGRLDAREWECYVNIYPDGVVMPYTGEVKARQMRSELSGVEVVRARVIEILDAARAAGGE